ncbi:MAG: prepilin-type N-terminal cleavage/methylation domain-containing protein [Spartobacteria bacterium]|nr:prepilin-type N-terminal cleavage/methylation domain-containing protein [Spartobacteria bacterium]
MTPLKPDHSYGHSPGFTLVEIMISLVICVLFASSLTVTLHIILRQVQTSSQTAEEILAFNDVSCRLWLQDKHAFKTDDTSVENMGTQIEQPYFVWNIYRYWFNTNNNSTFIISTLSYTGSENPQEVL